MFDLVDVNQLPIPDWGVICPQCQYTLTGVPAHRCPECGLTFHIRDLLRSDMAVRPPAFTGFESPLPDYGWNCRDCGSALAGARGGTCDVCEAPIRAGEYLPRGEWFVVDAGEFGWWEPSVLRDLLGEAQIPHAEQEQLNVVTLHMGARPAERSILIRSEYYCDACVLLRRERARLAARHAEGEWNCGGCGDENPPTFEVCWKCAAPRNPAAAGEQPPESLPG